MRHRIFYDRLNKQVFYTMSNDGLTSPPTNIPVSVVVTDNLPSAELLLRKRGYALTLLGEEGETIFDFYQYFEQATGQAFQPIDSMIPAPVMAGIEALCTAPVDPFAPLYYVSWDPISKVAHAPVLGAITVIENSPDQFAYEDATGVQLIKVGLQLEGYDVTAILS